jgi:DNA-directed RNA polymerase specialized sigma24 family protein
MLLTQTLKRVTKTTTVRPGSGFQEIKEAAVSGFTPEPPADLCYEDVAEDIERLVSMKVNLYNIPGFDRDDIAQEIRMVCVKAIDKWDASKNNSTPFHFLARCADNRLRNLVRDNAATLPKSKKDDKKAQERVAKKRALYSALSVGADIPEDSLGDYAEDHDASDLKESVEHNLPDDVRPSFQLLIKSGPPAIPKTHLRTIKRVIRDLYPGLI